MRVSRGYSLRFSTDKLWDFQLFRRTKREAKKYVYSHLFGRQMIRARTTVVVVVFFNVTQLAGLLGQQETNNKARGRGERWGADVRALFCLSPQPC